MARKWRFNKPLDYYVVRKNKIMATKTVNNATRPTSDCSRIWNQPTDSLSGPEEGECEGNTKDVPSSFKNGEEKQEKIS